ncbi:ral guanine nucleotide dissociation stimulator-like 1 isoform X2 [Syngnathus typhle]|uniref:ral guanine nucleotide dissociation stimulator-like 1 isoform X2 n=1 Tax=Syngnathus typhle TaxID=161592 RepID=UPI002A6A1A49|nr:ral guanine nucleotide dissociation stimulator-like 1 isoform X2 [Syngnathus typhle]
MCRNNLRSVHLYRIEGRAFFLKEGSDGGGSCSLHTKVGRMKKLLGLRLSHSVDAHIDKEPGVRLRSFQLLDSAEHCEEHVQEWVDEEENGAIFGITLRREPVMPSPNMPMASDCPAYSYAHYHTVKLRRLKAGTLEHLVTHLLDLEHQEPDYLHVFLSTYRAFTSTNNLIGMLFLSDDANPICSQSALFPVIKLWLREYRADFHEPPQYQSLRLLCANLRRRVCFRRLAQTAERLLKSFQQQDPSQFASVDDKVLPCKEEDGDAFMNFPVTDVAEQLTRLDMELFVQVIPFHCLGCVWSQRDKKENRNLAPTVRATISQFNTVTNLVITSLLCPSSPSPSTSSPISSPSSSSFLFPLSAPGLAHPSHTSPCFRARILEWWINVAQACRQLKNFSSLWAILSALQSNAVYRLKKTWMAVSKECMATFKHLCETFPDENCVLANREFLTEAGSQEEVSASSGSPLLSSKQMHKDGIVPYLGSYLTVLTMLDTALPDSVEGGLINFEKRRREFEILSQIRQLQASCSQYQIPANPRITNWLQAHALLLTDQESYELSRELEPPVDPCPTSPNVWSSRLLPKKLPSSQATSDGSQGKKTHADQMSVSSSSSSGSDMDDLVVPHLSPLRLIIKSLSSSMHNITEDYGTMSSSCSSSSSPMLSSSSCSSSHPDLSCSSLALRPDSSSSSVPPQSVLPVYNKQLADSCIIRVSMECVNNGNVYKSILLTSQDHTPQVIQRALDKHNLEDTFSCQDFILCQMLNNGNELHIPDNANVYYALCTSSNYDFVLHQRWKSHRKDWGSSSSPGIPRSERHTK